MSSASQSSAIGKPVSRSETAPTDFLGKALRPALLAPRSSLLAPARGVTLIELLVVVLVLTTLVAAAIPLLSPSSDERRIREAARDVNAFITGAQNKAIELRRPYGVALKKVSAITGRTIDNGVCTELAYVEQPPTYMGFGESSAARVSLYTSGNSSSYGGAGQLVLIQFVTRGNGIAFGTDGLPSGWDPDLFPDGVVRPGDVIEFSGTQYELLADTVVDDPTIDTRMTDGFFDADTGQAGANHATQIVARPINDTGQMINVMYDDYGVRLTDSTTFTSRRPPFWTHPASYKILRQPMPTSADPYQLPEGTAIDLRASGDDSGSFYTPSDPDPSFAAVVNDNDVPVVIMFAPEGSVQRVRFSLAPSNSVPFDDPVASTLYLLVGRRSIIPAPQLASDKTLNGTVFNTEEERLAAREPVNWMRGESRWIAIGSQSGRIVTTENAYVPLTYTSRDEQIKAAREFARQMTQMGGR